MTHADAVNLWSWGETGLFVCFGASYVLTMKRPLLGMPVMFSVWLVWVVLYDIAETYRNVNQ